MTIEQTGMNIERRDLDGLVCTRCGKVMSRVYDGHGGLTSFTFSFNGTSEAERHSLGKYAPGDYTFCVECVLDRMLGSQ
jgi:hypothetical protein